MAASVCHGCLIGLLFISCCPTQAAPAVYVAWFAAVSGKQADLKAGERLLDEHKGALDINAVDCSRALTALGWACRHGHSEYAAMLIRRGCDIKKAGSDPELRPLRSVVSWNHTECARLLLDAGADINEAASTGVTALHFAASWNSVAAVRLLLERGADRSLRCKDGKTALELAKAKENADVVDLLEPAPASTVTGLSFLCVCCACFRFVDIHVCRYLL